MRPDLSLRTAFRRLLDDDVLPANRQVVSSVDWRASAHPLTANGVPELLGLGRLRRLQRLGCLRFELLHLLLAEQALDPACLGCLR